MDIKVGDKIRFAEEKCEVSCSFHTYGHTARVISIHDRADRLQFNVQSYVMTNGVYTQTDRSSCVLRCRSNVLRSHFGNPCVFCGFEIIENRET